MAKFCGKCGARLDSEGYCPNRCADKIQKGSTQSQPSEVPKQVQDDKMASKKSLSRKESKKQSKLERKAQKKAAKKEKRMNWSTGKKVRRFFLKLILVVVFLAVFVVGITGTLTYFDVIDMPIVEEVLDKLGFYSKGISTSELYQQYTEINNQALKIEEKYADDGSVSNEQLPALLEELSVLAEQHKKQGILESYDVEEASIFMKFKSGVGYLYIPTNKDIMSGDQAGNILTVEPYATSAEFLAHYILGGKSPDKAAEEIADSLPELYVFDDAHNQDGFEIEDVGQLGNNKIIIWYGHGGYISEYGSVLGTSVSIKDKTSLSMYEKELENGEMVLGKDCFCLCPSYFDKHIADGALKGSMVYLAACESGRDNRLADVFFRKGATLVVGNTRSIFIRYNLYMMYDFLIALTNTYDDGTYWTAEDALQYAKDENGETDGKFMFCGAEVRLIYPNNESGYRLKPVDALMPIPDSNPEKRIPTDAAEFNGHYYYVYDIDTITDWNMAQEYCEAQGGYLATITSQEENDFLFSYMKQEGYSSAYFGFSDSSSEGTWVWCNGERSSYTNWHSGEPNNENQSENYALFYYKYSDGSWNDGDFGNKTVNGGTAFLCEWGDSPHIGQSRPETLESGFHYEMKTEVIEFPLSDGTLYYSNTIKYPYFVGNSVIESALNQRYADMIAYCKANDTDYDEQYQEWGDDEARLPYYDDTSSEVLYDGRGAISVKEIHVMWSGGMHPYHEVIGLNYDLATGKELTYHDILDGTDAQIDSALRYYYEKGVGKATDYIVSVMKEYTAYALCEEGLCFFYNVGDAVERAEIIIPYTSDDTYVISLSDLLP